MTRRPLPGPEHGQLPGFASLQSNEKPGRLTRSGLGPAMSAAARSSPSGSSGHRGRGDLRRGDEFPVHVVRCEGFGVGGRGSQGPRVKQQDDVDDGGEPVRDGRVAGAVGAPFLSFVLRIDPAVVRRVSVEMLEQRRAEMLVDSPPDPSKAFVSTLDSGLMSSVIRFLRALSTGPDRRILAPAYLQEMVYRVLQAEQYWRSRWR
jgi:AraC-type transcriptional regulator